jgi:hypothetical protein
MASDTSSSNPLLSPVQQSTANEYYSALLASLKAKGIEIRPDAGGGRGKGVFATESFQQGDVIWTERPLVRNALLTTLGGASNMTALALSSATNGNPVAAAAAAAATATAQPEVTRSTALHACILSLNTMSQLIQSACQLQAAVQQLDSKLEVSTCSHCFKAVGKASTAAGQQQHQQRASDTRTRLICHYSLVHITSAAAIMHSSC